MSRMRVWIDQDLCTGDSLCTEIVPEVFDMSDDGLAYVKEEAWPSVHDDDGKPILTGASGRATVSEELEEAVIEAAEECPGECIFIERCDTGVLG